MTDIRIDFTSDESVVKAMVLEACLEEEFVYSGTIKGARVYLGSNWKSARLHRFVAKLDEARNAVLERWPDASVMISGSTERSIWSTDDLKTCVQLSAFFPATQEAAAWLDAADKLSPAPEAPAEKCGKPAASFIPCWGMSFACVRPKGHEGDCRQGGTCVKHGEYFGERCPLWPSCIEDFVQGTVAEAPAGDGFEEWWKSSVGYVSPEDSARAAWSAALSSPAKVETGELPPIDETEAEAEQADRMAIADFSARVPGTWKIEVAQQSLREAYEEILCRRRQLLSALQELNRLKASAGKGEPKWAIPGDMKPVYLLRFDDPEGKEQIWDNLSDARSAWDKYAPAWNCWLFGPVDLNAALPSPPSLKGDKGGNDEVA